MYLAHNGPPACSLCSTEVLPIYRFCRHFPGLELIHEEPPVYIAHGFLSPEDCEALQRSAEGGQLPRLEYDNVSGLGFVPLEPATGLAWQPALAG